MFGTYARNVIAGQGRYYPDVEPEIPTISLELCDYDKTNKVLKLTSDHMGMPMTFFVKSHKTGRVVRFVPVTPADKLFDQDQWDGEQQIYRPVGQEMNTNIDHMVIYNAW
jgi:hypothetical protein